MTTSNAFMTAYDITKYTPKKHMGYKKDVNIRRLLGQYQIKHLYLDGVLYSPHGEVKMTQDFDHSTQKSAFLFAPNDASDDRVALSHVINDTGFLTELLSAHRRICDREYFSLNYEISLRSFYANTSEGIYYINPYVFSLKDALIISFEVLDDETKQPLSISDISAVVGNFNLLPIYGTRFQDEDNFTPYEGTIPDYIFDKIDSFLYDLDGGKRRAEEYSSLYNILALSNETGDVEADLCRLIGARSLDSPLENIGPQGLYAHYTQDMAAIITGYQPDDASAIYVTGILLEAIKMYIYLKQTINLEMTMDLQTVMRYDIYLENMFFAPHMKTETRNLLNFIYKTPTFTHHKEAVKLKIAYMTAQESSKKHRNTTLLNILLYLISLLGAIGTLETIERRLDVPFHISFWVVFGVFLIFGVVWFITEYNRKKKF